MAGQQGLGINEGPDVWLLLGWEPVLKSGIDSRSLRQVRDWNYSVILSGRIEGNFECLNFMRKRHQLREELPKFTANVQKYFLSHHKNKTEKHQSEQPFPECSLSIPNHSLINIRLQVSYRRVDQPSTSPLVGHPRPLLQT
ncbi:hypothetical protein CEXT_603531 [Caerostris extrusa]|uniref:Uncharacterized protein n=1 Tax=Caerostris extrusa TaxID=172846 RepID=A0AAV4PWH2_CAEEX|nr:hypothetical protein CEXT_603531 [Caerostris extrusa]